MIANHYSPKLSNIDHLVVEAVPPGGNWKNVPEHVPSARLSQIRESYRSGEGSRSTYYGRLRPDAPSYTISTYISRPGNGCHIHYEQNRLISQREAARLQSFPDDFAFQGSRNSVNQQVGNAVPPLLAFQIARQLGRPGAFADLFAGAGGLSLGLVWAGWKPAVDNDIDETFLATYRANIDRAVIPGDIRQREVFERVRDAAVAVKHRLKGRQFLVVGGPPCQGFSTAGNRRSIDDPRNQLFRDYVRFIEEVQPDGFIFENVMGLTNMEGGKVFEVVCDALRRVTGSLSVWKLSAEEYGIPQRRKRLFIIGLRDSRRSVATPTPVCARKPDDPSGKRGPITVKEALDDLPAIGAAEDGSDLEYRSAPQTSYQMLMRGLITPEQFLSELSKGVERLPAEASRPRR